MKTTIEDPRTTEQIIHDLKTEIADRNASLEGWKASFEGEKERHLKTKAELEKLKGLANEYIDLINEAEATIIELRKGIVNALTNKRT